MDLSKYKIKNYDESLETDFQRRKKQSMILSVDELKMASIVSKCYQLHIYAFM